MDDADAKYLHKILRVHCVVGEKHGTPYLEIMARGGRAHIAAWFTDESASAMRQLRPYQDIFIRCRGGGMADVPQLRDCVLEQVVRDPVPPEPLAAGDRKMRELQRLADELDIAIHVSHFPPGASKWNKIEHRLLSSISKNRRGRTMRTYKTIINLTSNTTNRGRLVVRALTASLPNWQADHCEGLPRPGDRAGRIPARMEQWNYVNQATSPGDVTGRPPCCIRGRLAACATWTYGPAGVGLSSSHRGEDGGAAMSRRSVRICMQISASTRRRGL
jgi:hypothetical protein